MSMKALTFVFASLLTLAIAAPSIASARDDHRRDNHHHHDDHHHKKSLIKKLLH